MKYLYTFAILIVLTGFGEPVRAQKTRLDSLFASADTTAVLDSLLEGFDKYLDSLYQPKSFFNISLGIGTGFFSFKNNNTFEYNTEKQLIFSPTAGYYHKSGLGISVNGFLMNENGKLNAYQYSMTPSFDYLKNKNFSTGISFTRYYTKEDLSFYTTPLKNELYSYFIFKKWWIQPGVAMSYGWGSRTEYSKEEIILNSVRFQNALGRGANYIYVESNESVKDYAVLLSVRHNFSWYKIFNSKDMFTVIPVIMVSGGSQNFGFNTSFSSPSQVVTNNFLPSNSNITSVSGFDTQSTTCILRVDYSVGKFYVQPQAYFDYYLHNADNRFNMVYAISAGFNF